MYASQREQDNGQQVIGTSATYGTPITRDMAARAFSAVQHPENWKLPVDTTLPLAQVVELGGCDVIRQAVAFFAGCTATTDDVGGNTIRVRARGYYAAVGA